MDEGINGDGSIVRTGARDRDPTKASAATGRPCHFLWLESALILTGAGDRQHPRATGRQVVLLSHPVSKILDVEYLPGRTGALV